MGIDDDGEAHVLLLLLLLAGSSCDDSWTSRETASCASLDDCRAKLLQEPKLEAAEQEGTKHRLLLPGNNKGGMALTDPDLLASAYLWRGCADHVVRTACACSTGLSLERLLECSGLLDMAAQAARAR